MEQGCQLEAQIAFFSRKSVSRDLQLLLIWPQVCSGCEEANRLFFPEKHNCPCCST
jgi:rRNA maturation endonuclease Nob1